MMRQDKWISRLGWLGASLVVVTACKARQPPVEYRASTTVKDIMDSMVDPSADALWDSVATIVSASGTEERAPHTDEEWKNVRDHAIRLVEATNLLLIPDRHVAKPGEKAENPEVELAPEEIEKRINEDRASWINLAHGLHDAALPALKAAEARNPQALFDAGDQIDAACENCHQKYWYPSAVPPPPAKK
jgi:hypothetical protein